jgi:tetratricopeptide (TPR) repeat protein
MERDEEVLAYAETLMSIDSSDLNLKVRLGLLYSDLERYEDAEKLFKEVLVSVPDSDKVLYYLGALNQQIKRIPESLSYYQQIPSTSPLFGDAGLQMAQLLAASAREDFVLGTFDSSKKFVEFIDGRLKENIESALELKMLLTSYYEDTFQYKEAIESLSSVKNHKNFTESHSYYLAAIMEKNGDYQEARTIVQNIIDKDPNNAHALNFLGYSYLERNEKMDQAYEYISKAVSLKPDDGYIRDSLAWYFYQTGKYHDALLHAKKAVELVKNDPTITKHLGMIYQRLRFYDKAKIYLTEALKHSKVEAEREDVLKILRDIEETRAPASKP